MENGDVDESSPVEVDVEAPASHEDHVLMPVDLPHPPQTYDAAIIVSNPPSIAFVFIRLAFEFKSSITFLTSFLVASLLM